MSFHHFIQLTPKGCCYRTVGQDGSHWIEKQQIFLNSFFFISEPSFSVKNVSYRTILSSINLDNVIYRHSSVTECYYVRHTNIPSCVCYLRNCVYTNTHCLLHGKCFCNPQRLHTSCTMDVSQSIFNLNIKKR